MPRWLPNAITVVRVVLMPAWVVVAEREREALAAGDSHPRMVLVGILLALGLSDLLDGFLARRFHFESHVGAVLDAVADKLAQVTVATYLTFRPVEGFFALPIGFWALLVVRDVVMATGWLTVKRRRGHVVSEHRWHGKLASVVLSVTLVAGVAGFGDAVLWALVVSSSVLVVGSTVGYFRIGLRQLSDARLVPRDPRRGAG